MKVSLKAMTADSFLDYLELAIPCYANANVESGRWDESGALDRSRLAYEKLLPQGPKTAGNYLFHIVDNSNELELGYVWVEVETATKSAFIYDIAIYEQHRRNGYAKLALSCVEAFVTTCGAVCLGLHVFNYNVAAQRLYLSVGYKVTVQNTETLVGHNMMKVLDEDTFQ
ncbi:GNAT family N-acetyltransferase [Vibrio gallicus]|uniref:GNAT family N-acetyltransferase n=1 Tax=Vibrio gallicus TaxID=190897 RepID=UPI0021C285CC|nr:GNAT family N-acetyltransferase [Vibrio gallicus]